MTTSSNSRSVLSSLKQQARDDPNEGLNFGDMHGSPLNACMTRLQQPISLTKALGFVCVVRVSLQYIPSGYF